VCCWLLFSAWLKFSLGLGQRPKSAFPRRSLRSLSTPNCRGQGHRQYATSLLLKLWLLMGARKKYMHPPVRLAWGDVSSQHGEGFTPCTCWQLEHSMYIVISELLTQLAIAVTLVPHKLGFPCKLKGANTARSERPEVQAQSSCFPSVPINNFHVSASATAGPGAVQVRVHLWPLPLCLSSFYSSVAVTLCCLLDVYKNA
jgi:hypothetical protein